MGKSGKGASRVVDPGVEAAQAFADDLRRNLISIPRALSRLGSESHCAACQELHQLFHRMVGDAALLGYGPLSDVAAELEDQFADAAEVAVPLSSQIEKNVEDFYRESGSGMSLSDARHLVAKQTLVAVEKPQVPSASIPVIARARLHVCAHLLERFAHQPKRDDFLEHVALQLIKLREVLAGGALSDLADEVKLASSLVQSLPRVSATRAQTTLSLLRDVLQRALELVSEPREAATSADVPKTTDAPVIDPSFEGALRNALSLLSNGELVAWARINEAGPETLAVVVAPSSSASVADFHAVLGQPDGEGDPWREIAVNRRRSHLIALRSGTYSDHVLLVANGHPVAAGLALVEARHALELVEKSFRGATASVPLAEEAGRVLVVDDSNTLREFVAGTLETSGFAVATAVDGLDALNALCREDFRLVVTDLEMPNMQGDELLSEIKRNPSWSNIPVVMCTSRSTDDVRRRAYDLGVTSFVAKPFSPETLVEAVTAACGDVAVQ